MSRLPRIPVPLVLAAAFLAGAAAPLAVGAAGSSSATTPASNGPSLAVYGQQWDPWGPDQLGSSSGVTIAAEGCALTAAAMLLQTYGVNTNPGTLNSWLTANGGYAEGDLLVWGAVASYAKAQGVTISYVGSEAENLGAIDSSLAAGEPVIAQVSLDGNMHFVLLTGTGPDGTIWMNDPWTADHTTFQSRYGNPATGIQSIRLYAGTAAAAAQLTTVSAGGAETVSGPAAPSGELGSDATGAAVLDLPYTTSTANWTSGTPLSVNSWSGSSVSFTAPSSLAAGDVVVQTAGDGPNYWFPYTPSAQSAVTVSGLSPSSGPAGGGTTVTLEGSGFQVPVSVAFGSTAAAVVTVLSPTELEATSPAGSGSETVQVGDWMGTSSGGTPDVFSYASDSQSAGALTTVAPTRICDTRPGNPSHLSGGAAQCTGKTLAAGKPLTVQVAGLAGMPSSGADAAVLNLTVTEPTGAGWVELYPAGESAPNTSNINFSAGQTVANLVEAGLGSAGQLELLTNVASVNVVLDLEGYVAPPATAGLGLYQTVAPTRICDTRTTQASNQCTGHTLGPQGHLTVQVTGLAGIPAGAEAAAINVTATNTTAPSFFTVFPSGTVPVTSNLNWTRGETVANLVVATLNSAGQVEVYNSSGTASLVVDVMGYYSAAGGSGSEFTPLSSPVRICDTRTTQASNQCTGHTLGAGGTLAVQATGLAGVPSGAKAVVVNLTVTNTSAASFLTVYPSGVRPATSSVNWSAGATVANLAIATLNSSGGFTVYNSAGSAAVIVDVEGWYS